MDKFNAFKMFLATVDHGSFGAAAAALGTDPSTVSKAITRLEEQLMYQLFFRSTRKLQVTEAGKVYVDAVRKLLAELDACENQLMAVNSQPEGVLKVNLPVSYGRLYVLPLLGEFSRRYPDIKLNITFSDKYVDIIEQGIDISIRSGSVSDSRLVARKLSPMDFIICASPAYLQQHEPIRSYDDLCHHKWVRFRYKQTGKVMPISTVNNTGGVDLINPDDSYVVDDGEAMLELCRSGLGITQAPHFLLRNELQNGELIPIFPLLRNENIGVYMLYPKRRFLPRKVSVFIEYIKEAIEIMGETPETTWASEITPVNS